MCQGNRKRDVTTMVTYSHATTSLGQSERAYYLSYFIINDVTENNMINKGYVAKKHTFYHNLH